MLHNLVSSLPWTWQRELAGSPWLTGMFESFLILRIFVLQFLADPFEACWCPGIRAIFRRILGYDKSTGLRQESNFHEVVEVFCWNILISNSQSLPWSCLWKGNSWLLFPGLPTRSEAALVSPCAQRQSTSSKAPGWGGSFLWDWLRICGLNSFFTAIYIHRSWAPSVVSYQANTMPCNRSYLACNSALKYIIL